MSAQELLDIADPTVRRATIKSQFLLVLKEIPDVDVAGIKYILVGLFDTWSEIRKDCSKYLHELIDYLPHHVCGLLQKDLIKQLQPSLPWQTIHGALLGLAASRTMQHSVQTTASIDEDVSRNCLPLLGHAVLPVREACLDCIASLGLLQNKGFIRSLLSLVMEDLRNEKDMSNRLGGVLSCLTIFCEHFIYSCSVHIELLPEILIVIHSAMQYASSTVRQLAGKIIVTLYCVNDKIDPSSGDSFLCRENVDSTYQKPKVAINSMLRKVFSNIVKVSGEEAVSPSTCGNQEKDTSADLQAESWELVEAVLIVSESILHHSILHALETCYVLDVKDQDALEVSEYVPGIPAADRQSLEELLRSLHLALPLLLLHPRFEIRRMASQMLPTVARSIFFILIPMSTPSHYDESLALQPKESFIECADWKSLDHVDSVALEIAACAFNIEIAKVVQSILEILIPPPQTAYQASTSTSVQGWLALSKGDTEASTSSPSSSSSSSQRCNNEQDSPALISLLPDSRCLLWCNKTSGRLNAQELLLEFQCKVRKLRRNDLDDEDEDADPEDVGKVHVSSAIDVYPPLLISLIEAIDYLRNGTPQTVAPALYKHSQNISMYFDTVMQQVPNLLHTQSSMQLLERLAEEERTSIEILSCDFIGYITTRAAALAYVRNSPAFGSFMTCSPVAGDAGKHADDYAIEWISCVSLLQMISSKMTRKPKDTSVTSDWSQDTAQKLLSVGYHISRTPSIDSGVPPALPRSLQRPPSLRMSGKANECAMLLMPPVTEPSTDVCRILELKGDAASERESCMSMSSTSSAISLTPKRRPSSTSTPTANTRANPFFPDATPSVAIISHDSDQTTAGSCGKTADLFEKIVVDVEKLNVTAGVAATTLTQAHAIKAGGAESMSRWLCSALLPIIPCLITLAPLTAISQHAFPTPTLSRAVTPRAIPPDSTNHTNLTNNHSRGSLSRQNSVSSESSVDLGSPEGKGPSPTDSRLQPLWRTFYLSVCAMKWMSKAFSDSLWLDGKGQGVRSMLYAFLLICGRMAYTAAEHKETFHSSSRNTAKTVIALHRILLTELLDLCASTAKEDSGLFDSMNWLLLCRSSRIICGIVKSLPSGMLTELRPLSGRLDSTRQCLQSTLTKQRELRVQQVGVRYASMSNESVENINEGDNGDENDGNDAGNVDDDDDDDDDEFSDWDADSDEDAPMNTGMMGAQSGGAGPCVGVGTDAEMTANELQKLMTDFEALRDRLAVGSG